MIAFAPGRFTARATLAATAVVAFATLSIADIDGGKDHPLAGRYEGSTIVYYKAHAFDEIALLKAPHDYAALLERKALDDRSGPEWLTLQGKITEIRYEIPEGRSSLEVIANYQASLKSNGFAVEFSCNDKACLTGNINDLYVLGQQLDPTNGISTAYFDHARYLLAKRDAPEGTAYAAVLAGEDKSRTVVFVRVVESKSMETDKIKLVKADEMKTAIDGAGRVELYGIQFDFDQATIKPESKPTLDQIAKLLADNPTLRLQIVGHTDGKGAEGYNLDLSKRRAASVVAELVRGYGVDGGRLTSEGLGMSQPIASNDTDEGRAKNRRVELVSRR